MNLIGQSLESHGEAWNNWKRIFTSLFPILPGAFTFVSNCILFIVEFGLLVICVSYCP